jgi:hypothetical protein
MCERGDILKLCKLAAVSNRVPVSKQRALKGWLTAGAEPNEIETKNKLNTSAMMFACKGGHYKIVELLIKAGGTVDQQNILGETPLSIACSRINTAKRFVYTVKVLLKHGANPNTWDTNKYVPLNWIAAYGHKTLAKLLLEKGASQNLWANKGLRPAPMARENGHEKLAAILQQAWDEELTKHDGDQAVKEQAQFRKRRVSRLEKQAKNGNSWEDKQRKRKLQKYEARQKKADDKHATRVLQVRPKYRNVQEEEEKSENDNFEAAWKRTAHSKVDGGSWAVLFRGKGATKLNASALALEPDGAHDPRSEARAARKEKQKSLNPANWGAAELLRCSGLFNLTKPIHVAPREREPETPAGSLPPPPANRAIQVKKYSPMKSDGGTFGSGATVASSQKWR